MPSALRWASSLGRQLVSKEEERQIQARKKAKVYPKWQYEQLESYKQYTESGRRRLEALEGALRFLTEKCGVLLGSIQSDMVHVIKIALLQKIFGDELVANLSYLHEKYKITELNNTVNGTFPRRSGKTECAAMIIACIVVSQPNGNCIMYNLTGTQAKEFLQTVLKYLRLFQEDEEYGWTLVRQDLRQHVEVQTRKYGTINRVQSFASGLKGDGKIDWSDPVKRLVSLLLLLLLNHTHSFFHVYFSLQLH